MINLKQKHFLGHLCPGPAWKYQLFTLDQATLFLEYVFQVRIWRLIDNSEPKSIFLIDLTYAVMYHTKRI